MRYLGLVLVFFGISPILWGQKPVFEHLTDQDGLSNSNVTSILKDSEGYMWFSTFNGLSRYDGYQFTNFLHNPEDSNSVCSNRIWGLVESKDNVLFITSPFNGFSTYDRRTETFQSYNHSSDNPSGLSGNMVLSIYEDKKGSMWLGTTVGLDKFDYKTKTFQHFYPFGKSILNYISGITEDKEGNLWLYGQSNRLCKFNPDKNTFEYLKFSDNPQAAEVYNHWGLVFYDSQSNLWVGNRLEGLLKIHPDGKRERYSIENKKLGSNTLMSIKEDKEGHIWICTDGGGLFEYSSASNSFRNFQHDPEDPSSLGSNAVYCLYESEPGLIWVGTYAAGLSILKKDKRKFLTIDARGPRGKRLLQKSVLAMEQADNGNVWMATDGGGLHLYDPVKLEFKNYTEQNGKTAANVITCLLKDEGNNLWCGSYRKGMFRIKSGSEKIERFSTETTKRLSSNNVFSFCETDDKIWIGFIGRGIDWYDKKTGTFTRSALDTIDHGGFAKSSIFKLFKDSKKRIWIGSENSGTVCYDPVNNKVYRFTFDLNNKQGIGSNDVRDILEDSKGTIWFATGKGGLSKLVNFDAKIFETYTIKDGLPSDHILNILEDNQHNFWLATDKGISYFKILEKKFFNFDTEDGVQKGRFNGNAKFKAADGTMYFGGIDGVNIFHPDNVHINALKPVVALTGFRIFNHALKSNEEFNGETYLEKAIGHSKEIELKYDDNVFSIEFAAMSFISPQSNQYAYKLEGFDHVWTYVDAKKRFASYTNLDPGTYTFRVIASNHDGVWNKEGATLTITIQPPWWKTWWFRVFLLLALIGSIRLFIYLRTRSIKKRNEFLEEEVKIQTAGLIRSNQEILQKNKILENNNLEISKKTERIMEQQEEILKQKSEVEQLNKTKDKLFSIIAHDLKNPVNALVMLSKRLRKEVKETTDTGKELINHVEISSERIKDLTFNLLEWTKTQIGNIKVNPEKISVHRLIEENIQLYFSQTSQKQITIEESTDPSLFVLADYNMVSTIVRNILSNGIKYTPKGGTISISYYSHEDEVIISFHDNGIGMKEDVLDKLFGDGINVSTRGTDNETGTGLGLMISREFAELNKGNIYAESTPGEGSTFYLCLPETIVVEENATVTHIPVRFPEEKNNVSEQNEVSINEQFIGKKILLVDDDPQVRESVKHILNDVFEIYEASDVKYAIELSEKNQPDLIISDVTMPGESGIDFCNYIKHNWITSHIPVILLTAQSSKGTQLEGLMAGADAYIIKPFDRNILLSTVNNLLTFLDNVKLRFSSDIDILPSKYTQNKLDEEVLSKAIRFIEQNISDPDLNGDMLCKELGISKTVLYTKLKTITGQTVNEFIRTIRLKKSVDLLIEGKMNITQISIEMGFNSASYYTKSFTAHFGFSPKEYLSRQKTENKLFS
jgi:signal transduction histidine kinase/ligand-binding sensor domain-containing protein/CheY-like chemotaxis protein/AraC-like DNA-binding protein